MFFFSSKFQIQMVHQCSQGQLCWLNLIHPVQPFYQKAEGEEPIIQVHYQPYYHMITEKIKCRGSATDKKLRSQFAFISAALTVKLWHKCNAKDIPETSQSFHLELTKLLPGTLIQNFNCYTSPSSVQKEFCQKHKQ